MKQRRNIRLLQDEGYYSDTEYPQFVGYANKQNKSHWLHTDPSVAGDLHSMLVELSEAERHSITEVLRLFVQYELQLGSFWTEIARTFPRAEVQRMALSFASMEASVHSAFYNEINKLLNQNSKEFHLSWKEDEILAERMKMLDDNCLLNKSTVIDKLVTLATYSFIEGAVLYSSFAFIKSFRANGHNKIPKINTGVDYVVIDEQLHLEGASSLYRALIQEAKPTEAELSHIHEKINEVAHTVFNHEIRIIESIYSKGDIPSVKKEDMITFVKSRVKLVLEYLQVPEELQEKYVIDVDNPVAKWFYLGINLPTLPDFFAVTSTAYSKDWDETKLRWDA